MMKMDIFWGLVLILNACEVGPRDQGKQRKPCERAKKASPSAGLRLL